MTLPFIQFVKDSKNFNELIKRRHTAFILLALIAQRSKRSNDSNFNDLEIGECYIGDFKTYGVTEKIYRNDKLFLEKYHFAAFKRASKGTIAKLLDKSIFDINIIDGASVGAIKGRSRGD